MHTLKRTHLTPLGKMPCNNTTVSCGFQGQDLSKTSACLAMQKGA